METPRALAEVIAELERTGLAVEVVDREWRLVWVSPQLQAVIGADPESLGVGRHWLETRDLPPWDTSFGGGSDFPVTRTLVPYIAYDMPGGTAALQAAVTNERRRRALEGVEPAEPPPILCWTVDWVEPDRPAATVGVFSARVREPDGTLIGTVLLYGSTLPATLLALVTRGDARMFARMGELSEPGRRSGAIVFADLEASSALSRRLSTAAYFRLIRAIATGFDRLVGEHQGIVGKHAGDGVTAFFLADQAGSVPDAARAALEVARRTADVARDAAASVAEDGVPLEPAGCALNVGVHWGDGLYVGQIVTHGRLEVTALGDEVNEAARIQQCARGGAILASKAVVERLSDGHARDLGLDPETVSYRTLGELEGVTDKALRDAATISVTDVRETLVEAEATAGRR